MNHYDQAIYALQSIVQELELDAKSIIKAHTNFCKDAVGRGEKPNKIEPYISHSSKSSFSLVWQRKAPIAPWHEKRISPRKFCCNTTTLAKASQPWALEAVLSCERSLADIRKRMQKIRSAIRMLEQMKRMHDQ